MHLLDETPSRKEGVFYNRVCQFAGALSVILKDLELNADSEGWLYFTQ